MYDAKNKQKSTSTISYLVFFATLAVIIPSIVSIIFPSLIISLTYPMGQEFVDPFETGAFTIPFLSVGIFLLGFSLLYYSGNLPYSIQRPIKFILHFEVSRKISFIVILILLTIYVGLSIEELAEPEIWPDFETLKRNLNEWPFEDKTGDFSLNYPHVKFFLLTISEEIFQNINQTLTHNGETLTHNRQTLTHNGHTQRTDTNTQQTNTNTQRTHTTERH